MNQSTRLARALLSAVLLIGGMAGCSETAITVDCRLTTDHTLWPALDGPEYVIRANDAVAEACLAFEEDAASLERMLAVQAPQLHRVRIDQPAGLVLTLVPQIVDMGVGYVSSPVYGHTHGYMSRYRGRTYYYDSFGVVGTEVNAYHRGFQHILGLAAWRPDPGQPAGRRVLWEGRAEVLDDGNDPRLTMPRLMAALIRFYGEATEKPVRVKIDREDQLLFAGRGIPTAGAPTALIPTQTQPCPAN